ncbi:hypothetical protein BDZ91DRAFT_743133 [Kalaharituber pfeilii]|nr:hypothetical protein BDZ91DRAFT_743133 [Kalaharituber pfeilii]
MPPVSSLLSLPPSPSEPNPLARIFVVPVLIPLPPRAVGRFAGSTGVASAVVFGTPPPRPAGVAVLRGLPLALGVAVAVAVSASVVALVLPVALPRPLAGVAEASPAPTLLLPLLTTAPLRAVSDSVASSIFTLVPIPGPIASAPSLSASTTTLILHDSPANPLSPAPVATTASPPPSRKLLVPAPAAAFEANDIRLIFPAGPAAPRL